MWILHFCFGSASEFSIWGQYFSSQKLTLSNLHSYFEKSAAWKSYYFYVEALHIDLKTNSRYLGFVLIAQITFSPQTTQINDDIT